jgi:hypothetical protein
MAHPLYHAVATTWRKYRAEGAPEDKMIVEARVGNDEYILTKYDLPLLHQIAMDADHTIQVIEHCGTFDVDGAPVRCYRVRMSISPLTRKKRPH